MIAPRGRVEKLKALGLYLIVVIPPIARSVYVGDPENSVLIVGISTALFVLAMAFLTLRDVILKRSTRVGEVYDRIRREHPHVDDARCRIAAEDEVFRESQGLQIAVFLFIVFTILAFMFGAMHVISR